MSTPHSDGPTVRATPFSASVEPSQNGFVHVRLDGELDLASVNELKDLLHAQLASGSEVVLDLSTLEFIDSSGLQSILVALKSSESLPGTLRIRSTISPQVHRLLEIAGVLDSLPLVDG